MADDRKTTGFGAKARQLMLGAAVTSAACLSAPSAQAATLHHIHHHYAAHSLVAHQAVHHNHVELAASHVGVVHPGYTTHHLLHHTAYRPRHIRYATARYHHSGLQCVPYAREVSHIDLSGNAFLWWAEAAGRYARGNTPTEGAVLNFRPIGRMPLGHVAVVTSVIDSRTVLVTQANWIPGTITNDVTVEDVSDNNDWSEVQVELGDSSKWGAPYPTYGFIYNQPDNGTVIAAVAQGNEVADAPTPAPITDDAPDRALQ